jgi:hypothetical protein
LPRKYASTMLYIPLTSMTMIIGTAVFAKITGMLPRKKGFSEELILVSKYTHGEL